MYFINKYIAVRSSTSHDLGTGPFEDGDPRNALYRTWGDCRDAFLAYTQALNELDANGRAPDSMFHQRYLDAAEQTAYALYDIVSKTSTWYQNSLPTRAYHFKPVEFMAWEWPGYDTPNYPRSFAVPSTRFLPAPVWPRGPADPALWSHIAPSSAASSAS